MHKLIVRVIKGRTYICDESGLELFESTPDCHGYFKDEKLAEIIVHAFNEHAPSDWSKQLEKSWECLTI